MSTTKTELTEEQKVILDPNPPGWVLNTIKQTQDQQDKVYNAAVTAYKLASDSWLKNAELANAGGTKWPPFTVPIPQRVVLYPSVITSGSFWFQVLEIDPSIQPPVAPPPITNPNKGNPLGTLAGANTDMQNTMLSLILNDLEAIKKAMNIK